MTCKVLGNMNFDLESEVCFLRGPQSMISHRAASHYLLSFKVGFTIPLLSILNRNYH